MKEMAKKTRESRERMAKTEANFAEISKAWDKEKGKEKEDIAMLADEASENNEFEARERNNANIVNRAPVEAASNIMTSDEIQDQRERGQILR